MDWSKAKTILIIALLVSCLSLGGLLLNDRKKEAENDRLAVEAAGLYLKEQGVSSICDIPLKRPKLPVLFVQFYSTLDSSVHKQLTEYKGRDLICIIEAEQSAYYPELKEAGKTKAKVCTASSALLSVCASMENIRNLEIKEINLVYYIQLSEVSENLEDTAIPSWQIVTDRGTYYVNAFVL